jgi:hypothetical protein
MDRELIAARVIANEIGVANQRDLGALSSTCAHVVSYVDRRRSMHRSQCTAGAAAEWDADAEQRGKRKSYNKATTGMDWLSRSDGSVCHGGDVHC